MDPSETSSPSSAGPAIARVVVDPPTDGAWNMAVDEALLDAAAAGSCAVLRFYRWRAATLSLGYFQRERDRDGHAASRNCPLVRRSSGGGAIVHDAELTYSLVVPQRRQPAADGPALYGTVHEGLIAALRMQGVAARLCRNAPECGTKNEPFLCFLRRTVGDVLVGTAKIAGSAQRRRKGATLQHGSVLLARSAAAPELPGIAQLTGTKLDCRKLMRDWSSQLEERLGLGFKPGEYGDACRDRARQLVAEKYASASWAKRR